MKNLCNCCILDGCKFVIPVIMEWLTLDVHNYALKQNNCLRVGAHCLDVLYLVAVLPLDVMISLEFLP